jgi:flagellar basal-body rod modification protein FlgD
MVGRSVLMEGNTASLPAGGSLQAGVELPVATRNGFVRIFDSAGGLIRELPLGDREQGLATFSWDGTTGDGSTAPAGAYRILAGYRDGGQETQATTYISTRVAGVSLGASGGRPELTTESGRRIGLGDIRAIL